MGHSVSSNPYLYEKYSIFDIQKYIEEGGYKTYFTKDGLIVERTDVYVYFPIVDDVNDLVFAEMQMKLYKPLYDPVANKKLFANLKKHFGRKREEKFPAREEAEALIKDAHKIEELKRSLSKKSWQFWK